MGAGPGTRHTHILRHRHGARICLSITPRMITAPLFSCCNLLLSEGAGAGVVLRDTHVSPNVTEDGKITLKI